MSLLSLHLLTPRDGVLFAVGSVWETDVEGTRLVLVFISGSTGKKRKFVTAEFTTLFRGIIIIRVATFVGFAALDHWKKYQSSNL